ncbi:MAG TPA: hypothetical protein VII92_17750 [Anaerolineae bacterium]
MIRTEILACIATLLAIWLAVGTMDYQYAIERERDDLAAQVRTLKAQVADPPRLCREFYRSKLKGSK